jgi:hypothetical protein
MTRFWNNLHQVREFSIYVSDCTVERFSFSVHCTCKISATVAFPILHRVIHCILILMQICDVSFNELNRVITYNVRVPKF